MQNFTSPYYYGICCLMAWGMLLSTFSANAQQYYYKGNSATSTKVEVGNAIYYADYLHGRTTAAGEVYRQEAFTCAHRTHSKGTLLKVSRMDNGASVVVRVNDVGPYSQGDIINLSKAAAMKIGLVRDGRARVKVEPVGHSDQNPGEQPRQQAPASYDQTPRNPGTVYYSTTPQQQYYSNNQYTTKGGYYSPGNKQQAYGYNNNTQVPKGYDTRVPNSYNQTEELATGVKGYAIQLASFKNLDNATRQVQDIRNKGIKDVYLMKKGGLNKVVIATFPNKFAAQQYLDRLRQQHLMDGIVIMLR
jgi:rare lipoprotein A (peptidoglycan hydrolase)